MSNNNKYVEHNRRADIMKRIHRMIRFCISGKTATSLTWVTLLEGTHEKNALITIVTKIPTNCLVPSELYRVDRKWALQLTDYIDYKSQDYSESYRTIIGDSTATDQYILPQFQSNQKHTDFTTIANNYSCIWINWNRTPRWLRCGIGVSSSFMRATTRNRKTETKVKNQLVLAYAMLIEFYEKFIEQKKSTRKVVNGKTIKTRFRLSSSL